MADDDVEVTDFSDRWDALPPEEEPDEQTQQKQELLKMLAVADQTVPKTNQYTPDQLSQLGMQEIIKHASGQPSAARVTPPVGYEAPVNPNPPPPRPAVDDSSQGFLDLLAKGRAEAPSPVTMSPDTPQLQQPDYSEKPGAKIDMLSTKSTPGKTFSPQVERAIEAAAKMNGMDPNVLRGFVSVESGGNPSSNMNKETQYKGLMQIGRDEWRRHGGGKDIYDPDANMAGGARLMEENRQAFARKFGKEPTPAQLYLMHQQGLGFYTRNATTNLRGNLPPDARTPENLTHDGFERWWTNRINRAISERGSAPTMRKAEANLPDGYLLPYPMADLPIKSTGGIPDSPQAQAEIAQLMQGKSLTDRAGTERASREVAAAALKDPKIAPQVIPGVKTLPKQLPVQGELPQDPRVNQTDTLPIPGIVTPGGRALMDATSPSFLSTIQNYQAMEAPPPAAPIAPTPTSFLDKLKAVVAGFKPVGEGGDDMRRKAVGQLQDSPLPNRSVIDWMRELSKKDQEFTSGVVSGVSHMPSDVVGTGVGTLAGAIGLATGSDTLKQFAGQTQADIETAKRGIQQSYGINPDAPTGAQKAGDVIGSNLSPSILGTIANTALGLAGEKVVGPAAEYMSKNYPIPNLNPIQPAQAASVFGAPPMIVQTPGGPVVMNDASIQGFVYGGVFSMGFGASIAGASRGVRFMKEPVMRAVGMGGLFDPRREVPGAPGTVASSIPSDILKGGIVDRAAAMMDIADRQARYEKGTWVGIDPVASDAAIQKWKIQTGSGAQNLIERAVVEGKLHTDDFRFDVPVPIGKLHEFAQANPEFPHYLKARMIIEELTHNAVQRARLQPGSKKAIDYPSILTDRDGIAWDLQNAHNTAQRMETDNPAFVQQHLNYKNNLTETRDFISNPNTNAVENAGALGRSAMSRPTMPIFSHNADTKSIISRVLAGDNPLHITETKMREAMSNQMKRDVEQSYMDMTYRNAFTPRDQKWATGPAGATARSEGAVLRRKVNGEVRYWTADPLLVSLMNADHVPPTGWGRAASIGKNWFQTATTGVMAPWFAPTGGIRAMEQGWTNAPSGVRTASGYGVRPAGPVSTLAAIPAQIVPRALGKLSPRVEWFENVIKNSDLGMLIDPKYHNVISRTMEKAYNDSFYKRMLDAGAYSGVTLQQDRVIHTNITNARMANQNSNVSAIHDFMANASHAWTKFAAEPAKATFRAANESLRAVQEAPNFAWAYKTGKFADAKNRPTINGRPMSDAEIAARMRNYTGDPSTRGFIYSKDQFSGKSETLRYSGPGKTRAEGYKILAQGVHGARVSTPWAGVLIQSPASTLKAMRDNPIRANLAFAASHVMPEAVAYLWNTYHSTPENDYVGYMMDGRGNNALLNNIYFATPGQRPEDGVEMRYYQEGIFHRYMTRAFMQQFYGRNITNIGEDVQNALRGLLGGAIIPPQPSWLSAMYGMNSMVAPEGFLGGVFRKRQNPYVELGGNESATELTLRALLPSLTDMFQQAYTAGMSASTWGEAPAAAGKQVAERAAGRAAIVGDILGYKPARAGSTHISEELWKRKHTIDDLMYRYRAWDINEGDVKFKDASKRGGNFITPFMPEKPPTNSDYIPNPGMTQAQPKNPLYKIMMGELQKTFESDNPEKGAIGFKSMWKQYQAYGSLAARMRTVNEGNAAAWNARQEKNESQVEFLITNNVDPFNYKQVRDFYNARRNEVAKTLLNTIYATEQRIDKMPNVRAMLKDKKFTIDMLDPNKIGIQTSDEDEATSGTE